MTPLETDRQFFAALIGADAPVLDRLLADDFVLIDVMAGGEIAKTPLLAAISAGAAKFEAIEPAEQRARLYSGTAVVTGRTRMKMRLGETAVAVNSRYTHVYVGQNGSWRLVAAQGTQILPAPEPPAA
jgi:hypothetical protein